MGALNYSKSFLYFLKYYVPLRNNDVQNPDLKPQEQHILNSRHFFSAFSCLWLNLEPNVRKTRKRGCNKIKSDADGYDSVCHCNQIWIILYKQNHLKHSNQNQTSLEYAF